MPIYEGWPDAEQIGGTHGDDTMSGNGGNDVLYSMPKDLMSGRADGTVMFALPPLADQERGSDALYGGEGHDTLWAGGGRDHLQGDDGNDRLIGNAGPDVMVGGPGADRFEYWLPTDSGFEIDATADRILDFQVGEDVIDLGRLQNPHDPGYIYRGSEPFIESAQLQVRVFAVQGMYETYTTHVQFSAPNTTTPQAFVNGEILLHGRFDGVPPAVMFDLIPETLEAGVPFQGPGVSPPEVIPPPVSSPPPPAPKAWESPQQAMATRLYDTIFDRVPDADGLRYWTDVLDTYSLQQVADGFMGSPEWQAKYGTPSHGDFVGRLYQNVLNRPGEADGMAFWTGDLEAGVIQRNQVVVAFSEAPEHQSLITPDGWLPW